MKYLNKLTALAVLFALTSCGASVTAPPVPVEKPMAEVGDGDVDEVLRFAGYFKGLSPEARKQECRGITQDWSRYDSIGIRLHLVIAQVLTPGCGSLQQSLELLESVQQEVDSERLSQLAAMQLAYIERLIAETKQKKALENRLSRAKSQANQAGVGEKNLATQLRTRESEVQELQALVEMLNLELFDLQSKLDALKSIEQNLNER